MTVLFWKIKDAYGDVENMEIPEDNTPEEENTEPTELVQAPFPLGYIPDPEDPRDYKLSSVLSSEVRRKNYVDYSPEMSEVKDQGEKGACVGFAVAAMVEWQQQQEYLKEIEQGNTYTRDKKHYDLSEQWIYHRAREIDGFSDDSGGTTLRAALKIVNKYGVPPEEGWNYNDHIIGRPKFWSYSTAKWARSKSYYRIDSIEEMKDTLVNIGPFVTGVLVFYEFFYPDNNGYIDYPSNTNNYYGGHAICITGYDDDRQCFKFKNSWGKNWGKDGYGWLPYSYMRDFSIISWVSIDKNIRSL